MNITIQTTFTAADNYDDGDDDVDNDGGLRQPSPLRTRAPGAKSTESESYDIC